MKYSKALLAVLSAILILSALFGCAAPTASEAAAEKPSTEAVEPAAEAVAEDAQPATVTDMMGREITIPEKIEKIVALTASDCEIIYALGAGELMVGRGEYCNYPEEALSVEAVSSGSETNLEQIIALEPQIVFMNSMDQTEEQIKALEDAGITVVMNDADTIDEVYTSIELIGSVLGRSDKAGEIINEMKSTFDELKKSVSEAEKKPTVYFEVSPLEYGLWTAGNGTFMNEIAEMLGLENIFADVDGWAEVSEEQVIERNPDYIVTITMYYGEGQTPVEEIMSRPGWEKISAVANGNVFNADSDTLSRPAPRLADAARELYGFVYSE